MSKPQAKLVQELKLNFKMYGTSNTSSTFDREKQSLQNFKNVIIPSKNLAALPSAHTFSSNNFSSASGLAT